MPKANNQKDIIKWLVGHLFDPPILLALCTVVFYIFAYQYLTAFFGILSIPIVDYPIYFYFAPGYFLLYRLVEFLICALFVFALYKFRENFKNKTHKKPKSYHFIFMVGYGVVIIGIWIFILPYPWGASIFRILLAIAMLVSIFLIQLDDGLKYFLEKMENHPVISSIMFSIPYVVLIVAIYFALIWAPATWGNNAAVTQINKGGEIKLKLVDNSSGLSNVTLILRTYQNGRYVVADNRTSRSAVYVIPDSQVRKATIPYKPTQSKEVWRGPFLYPNDG